MILTVFKKRKDGTGEDLVSIQEVVRVSRDERVPLKLGKESPQVLKRFKEGKARGGVFALQLITTANVLAKACHPEEGLFAEEGLWAGLCADDGRELVRYETVMYGLPLWRVVSFSNGITGKESPLAYLWNETPPK